MLRSTSYSITVKALPRTRRGERIVRADVGVRFDWGTPFVIDFHLPEDTQLLRDMLRRLRVTPFEDWLGEHGYDKYGNCVSSNCTFGELSTG